MPLSLAVTLAAKLHVGGVCEMLEGVARLLNSAFEMGRRGEPLSLTWEWGGERGGGGGRSKILSLCFDVCTLVSSLLEVDAVRVFARAQGAVTLFGLAPQNPVAMW